MRNHIGRTLMLFFVAGAIAAWSGAAAQGGAGSSDGRGALVDVALNDSPGGAPLGVRAGEAAPGIALQRRRIVEVFAAGIQNFNIVRRRWVFVMPLPALPGPCFLDNGLRRRVLLALAEREG